MATDVDVLGEIWGDIQDELSGRAGVPMPPERRGRARVVYNMVLFLAPSEGDAPPPDERFMPVHASDVSGNGVAFWTPQPHEVGQRLVLQLGHAMQPNYVEAQVVRCVRLSTEEDHHKFIVGCKFTRILAAAGEPGGL